VFLKLEIKYVLLSIYCLTLFPGKLKSRCEGPHEVGEAYPSGAVILKGTLAFPWIVNRQWLKHYRSDEVNETLVIHFCDEEEELQKRYESLDNHSVIFILFESFSSVLMFFFAFHLSFLSD
jgi:hypothetical protein